MPTPGVEVAWEITFLPLEPKLLLSLAYLPSVLGNLWGRERYIALDLQPLVSFKMGKYLDLNLEFLVGFGYGQCLFPCTQRGHAGSCTPKRLPEYNRWVGTSALSTARASSVLWITRNLSQPRGGGSGHVRNHKMHGHFKAPRIAPLRKGTAILTHTALVWESARLASKTSSPTACTTGRKSQAPTQLAFRGVLPKMGKVEKHSQGMKTTPDLILPLVLSNFVQIHKLTFDFRTHCSYSFFLLFKRNHFLSHCFMMTLIIFLSRLLKVVHVFKN